MNIKYKINAPVKIEDIIELYNDSGLNRPTKDAQRIRDLYKNSNLIVSAWHEGSLVGVARSLTDFRYCCYLSDLAVSKEYQKKGIGKALIDATKEYLGEECMLLLLSAPNAMEYYPKIGFEKSDNAFIIKREN